MRTKGDLRGLGTGANPLIGAAADHLVIQQGAQRRVIREGSRHIRRASRSAGGPLQTGGGSPSVKVPGTGRNLLAGHGLAATASEGPVQDLALSCSLDLPLFVELAVSLLISAGLFLPCCGLPHLDAVLAGRLQPSADRGEYG